MVLKRLRSDGTEMYQNAWTTCLAFVCWSIRCRRIVRGNFTTTTVTRGSDETRTTARGLKTNTEEKGSNVGWKSSG